VKRDVKVRVAGVGGLVVVVWVVVVAIRLLSVAVDGDWLVLPGVESGLAERRKRFVKVGRMERLDSAFVPVVSVVVRVVRLRRDRRIE
jgi:hypothetical protein